MTLVATMLGLALLGWAEQAGATIPASERQALIDLYNATRGGGWQHNTNWNAPAGTECTWYGVTCDSGGTTVQQLHFYGNSLVGTLPATLGNLTGLLTLDLSGNQLTGSIPTQLGSLTNLQELDLHNNQITGSIPIQFGNLTNLQALNLSYNQLTGSIPDLTGLANLQTLSLAYNYFDPSLVPAWLAAMTNLRRIELWSDHLTGSIPNWLGSLTNLTYLALDENRFTGSIPPQLGGLTSLQDLSLSGNQLTGSIPPQLGGLTSLQDLGLSGNQLSGSIPPQLGGLTSLQDLGLSGNQLTGSIPTELANLANLQDLELWGNQLTGSIPAQLGSLTKLQRLDLSSNQLSGSMPNQLGNLANLQRLYLDENELTGSIPTELGNLKNLVDLYLSSNKLSGPLPTELGNLTNLWLLTLSSNQLVGAVPSSITNMTGLPSYYGGDSIDFRWNGLYSSDPAVVSFLNGRQQGGDWQSTQTVAPTGLASGATTSTSVALSWAPIAYTGDTGGYQVFYATTSGGPYTLSGMTADKSASGWTVTGLNPGTTYFFIVKSVTNPNANNQNTVTSDPSGEVQATTSARCTPPSITTEPQSTTIVSGQTATLSVTASGTALLSYQWYMGTSGVGILPVGGNSSSFTTSALTATTSYWVRVSNGCGHADSTTATVSINCQAPATPSGLTISYSPTTITVGTPITFTGSATSATSYAWLLDGILSMGQTQQVSYNFLASQVGSHPVELTATNCLGSSSKQMIISVTPACAFTKAPGLVVSYSPTGPLAGFPEQQQPMVGQVVTFDPSGSTNIDANTTWNWAFAGTTPATSTQEKPQVTFSIPVLASVVMNATNCVGMSWYTGRPVQIFADVRHITANFSWDATAPTTGAVITFSAVNDDAHGDPNTFTWNFGDSTPAQTGRTTTHAYSCAGNYNVTLVASGHGQTSMPAVKPIGVSGTICGSSYLMVVDAADINGLNGTHWQTDMRIFNPATDPSMISMWFLPVGQDNSVPAFSGLTIEPKATWSIDNVIDWVNKQLGTSYTKTALRITYDNPESMAPMIVSRTYTQAQGGGTYGEFCSGIKVIPNTTPPALWVTGVRNNGLVTGFRTNYSLVNLRGDPGGINNVKITLLDPVGTEQANILLGIPPYGYFQGSIASLFGAPFANIGTFALRVDVPQGTDLRFYASVVNNQTGAPTLIPAGVPGNSPVYLAAIGHNPGQNGTVWRSDLQLTNVDTAQHTWEVKFIPKSNLPIALQDVTLPAKNTWRQDDIVSWLYSPLQPPDASGIVRIASADGSGVYPMVASSSYNLTANGTFGQNNLPLTAVMGISTTTPMQHLLLTAMSSADIARTNLGFINLSENNGVTFSVMFYDESGNVLNPIDSGTGQPFTLALNQSGWLQSQLENFFLVLGTTLPAGNKAISAEITVLAGGPGLAYATVIDNVTGDPMFIPAQLAP